jgi:DNA-binding phage protein
MRKDKIRLTVYTPRRTVVNMRKVIIGRLKQLGRSRLWLAEQVGVRPATIYDFLSGKASAKVKTIETVLSVLGIELKAKG